MRLATPARNRLIVRTVPGLESCVRAELRDLDIAPSDESTATRRRPNGEVRVPHASAGDLYAACSFLRCASRVVVPLVRFHATNFADLQREVTRLHEDGQLAPWLDDYTPLDVRVKTRDSALWHEGAVQERLVRWLHGEPSPAR